MEVRFALSLVFTFTLDDQSEEYVLTLMNVNCVSLELSFLWIATVQEWIVWGTNFDSFYSKP